MTFKKCLFALCMEKNVYFLNYPKDNCKVIFMFLLYIRLYAVEVHIVEQQYNVYSFTYFFLTQYDYKYQIYRAGDVTFDNEYGEKCIIIIFFLQMVGSEILLCASYAD